LMATDYYELLGVPKNADDATIKAAYRQMAKDCHPDRKGGCKEHEAKFKAINEAYDCLKDPQKRAAYDRFGHAAFQNGMNGQGPFGGGAGGGFEGFSDIFSSIFGEFMDPRAQRASAARGSDLRYDLELTLEESFLGVEKTIAVQALAACEACNASGSKGHAAARTCGTCGGAGKVRTQQGFFVVERTCPGCMGSGETIGDPCMACEGEGGAGVEGGGSAAGWEDVGERARSSRTRAEKISVNSGGRPSGRLGCSPAARRWRKRPAAPRGSG